MQCHTEHTVFCDKLITWLAESPGLSGRRKLEGATASAEGPLQEGQQAHSGTGNSTTPAETACSTTGACGLGFILEP